MLDSTLDPATEAQIREWRSYLLRRGTVHDQDLDELEDHLRSQISSLGAAGLSGDESFLVAIRRIGAVSELSREFARERSSRLWKQLVVGEDAAGERAAWISRDVVITIAFAIAAAVAIKLPALFGIDPFAAGDDASTGDESFYLRNASLLVLPVLVGFFWWRRRLASRVVAAIAAVFVAAAVLVNALPFESGGDTEALAAIHVPVALWLVAGIAYLGGAWRSDAPRMEFVRFTGEWVIYYALVALGGGVLVALTIGVFDAIGVDAEPFVTAWLLPGGAAGAVVVVARLVEAKQSAIENMAPVLTGVFSPLFALMLLAAMVAMAVTGNVVDADREVLIAFDLLLVLVVGLVLYAISARDPEARPGAMDAVQLVLVVAALAIDIMALAAILGRISDFGWTPNRTAGLGLNLVLLVNLAWSGWLLAGVLRGRRRFLELERWQTAYIPVYAAWAAAVVAVFPPLFGFE